MSLTHNEVVKLLALVAAIDDIEVTESKIAAWKAMAEHGQWESFDAARQALLVYRNEHPDFPIRPGHITGVLERVRGEADRRFNAQNNNPPDAVADDPRAYQRWVLDAAADNKRQVFAEFAAGQRPTLRAIAAS